MGCITRNALRTLGLLAAVVMLAVAAWPASASAYVTADAYNFDMFTDRVNTYGGCRTISQEDRQHYRWVDSPPHTSRISVNSCNNLATYTSRDISPGNTDYTLIGEFGYFYSIVYRGRALYNAFYNHDGRMLY